MGKCGIVGTGASGRNAGAHVRQAVVSAQTDNSDWRRRMWAVCGEAHTRMLMRRDALRRSSSYCCLYSWPCRSARRASSGVMAG